MYYKLFIFGEDKLFALAEIMGGEWLRPGDIFLFKNVRYKVLFHLRIARELEWKDGKRFYPINGEDEISLKNAELPELYITSVPSF